MKSVFITGGASGIGRATAKHMAVNGCRVCLADLDIERLNSVVQTISGTTALTLDVSNESDWQACAAELRVADIVIDAVVHAAGISAAAPLTDMTLEDWRRVHAVNLDGAFLATKYGAQLMGDAGGAIVHIASASGVRPTAGAAAYCSSKAAVRMLTRVAAVELKPRDIRVNCICPAGVRTPMWETMDFFQEAVARLGSVAAAYQELEAQGGSRFASPEDIAAAVAFLLSDAAKLMTGAELVVDDGFTLGGGS